MKRERWLLPEEIAEALRVTVEDVHRLCDAREFAVLELPGGARRIDALSFSRFLRARRLGYELQPAVSA
jgi:Helix-turn-helix domain